MCTCTYIYIHYLHTRSGASGFLLPLSGGADSASVATIVYSMCKLVVQAAGEMDEQVISDINRITQENVFTQNSHNMNRQNTVALLTTDNTHTGIIALS